MNEFDNDDDLNELSMILSLPLSYHPSKTTSTRQDIENKPPPPPLREVAQSQCNVTQYYHGNFFQVLCHKQKHPINFLIPNTHYVCWHTPHVAPFAICLSAAHLLIQMVFFFAPSVLHTYTFLPCLSHTLLHDDVQVFRN